MPIQSDGKRNARTLILLTRDDPELRMAKKPGGMFHKQQSASSQGELEGKVLEWDPATGVTQVLAQNLWFPNGVAVSVDEKFLVVAEMYGTSFPPMGASH